jgi:hypothetical protein
MLFNRWWLQVFTDYEKRKAKLPEKSLSGIGILPLVNCVSPALVFRFMLSWGPLLRVPTPLPPSFTPSEGRYKSFE